MLGLEFEDFELISAQNEFWILKSDIIIFNDNIIDEIRDNADDYFDLVHEDALMNFEKIICY